MDLSVSGSPIGVAASIAPTTGDSRVLTLTASSTATLGPATVTITGTGGGLTRTATISVNINPAADARLCAVRLPTSLNVAAARGGTSTITITRTGGFTAGVTFTAGAAPTSVTVSQPNPATGGSSVMTVSASSAAALGAVTLNVSGAGGGLTGTLRSISP